ncbi:hypothetical protein PRIPAC_71425 [Pristionchus pacificus]|nr:hypothetical protein PRIPAC_71425 [Pristionchus pacificus]
MSRPPDSLVEFCGFHPNASTFQWRYLIDEDTSTFLPCWEASVIVLLNLPLFFVAIVTICVVSNGFPRYDRLSIYWIYMSRIGVSVGLFITFLLCSVLSYASDMYILPWPQLIEYGFLIIVWTLYGAVWVGSIMCSSWTHSGWLNLTYFLGSKSFFLIVTQRWMQFGFYDPRTFIILASVILGIFNALTKVAEWRIRRTANAHELLEEEYINLDVNADEGAGLMSKFFFWWTNPLIDKGSKKQLNGIDDVFSLPPSLSVAHIEREIVENSPSFFSDGEHFSLTRALLRTFGLPFVLLAIPRLLSDLFTFAGPILLHLLVTTLEDPEPNGYSWLYAGGMMMTTFAAAMTSTHFNYQVQKMSLRVRAASVTSIMDKLMRVPLSQLGVHSTGQIINFVSSDVDRIVNFCNSFHAFWSLPVQLTIALYLLYREVGLAFVAGLIAAIVLIPINKKITSMIGSRSEKMMHAKDQRVKLITETMSGMRAVKMSAWEEFFEKRIGELRKEELVHLKARKYLDALCVYLWASTPLIVTLSILSTYTLLLHERLTAAKVFTALALVNILIMPLNAFPWVLNGLVEALVSLKRLSKFFALPNMDYSHLYTLSQNPDQYLEVEDASFSWKLIEDVKTISGVSFVGYKGSIVGVGGPVGSGKSTILLGLLGEATVDATKMGIRQEILDEGIAYVGQECWLSRGTIRENIVCGLSFDVEKYNEVVNAACLTRDIKLMPGGDSYEISENGATLSGGQRVRVMLARALYQDNQVYLLDDPFASLDRTVVDHIWKEAVMGMLKSRGKLIVVSTHDSRLLGKTDHLIMLNGEGRVASSGRPEDVMKEMKEDEESLNQREEKSEGEEETHEYVVAMEEEKMEGAVKRSVYKSYMEATGRFLVFSIITAIIGMQIFKNTADWWLTKWTEGQENGTEVRSVKGLLTGPRQSNLLGDEELNRSVHFLTVYTAIAGANTILTLMRAFLFAKGGIVSAKTLHENLLHKLLSAPLSWWDRTPTGRVINRLCSDVYTVDDNLPFQMNIFLASLVNLIGALIISLIGLPTLVPLVLILFIIYFFIQRKYRMTTVELKRLSSLSLSPLYSVLNDAVSGLAPIRAHRFVERFAQLVRVRLTGVLRTNFSSLAASQWLTIRLSIIAVVVVSYISFAAVIQHRLHFVDSGMVGLAVTYALSLTSLLNGLLGSFIETEKEMVSVERMQEYIEKLPEEDEEGEIEIPSEVEGRIEMQFVSVRYEKNLPLALNSVNLKIEAGQKVAIIGRTGSGKSTIFQTLLRACDIDSGNVFIDGMDISKMPLKSLRRLFGVVPQHPFLFSGTLTENLTVNTTRSDRNAMAHLMRVAQLESLLQRIGGLDGEIEEGGKNLSAGEKQIVSLCRLLLTKPKIVLVDEATAHMDDLTRDKIFSLLNTCLPLCTLLSIVHRPHSLKAYDVVIRMDGGKIVHYGVPSESDLVRLEEESHA